MDTTKLTLFSLITKGIVLKFLTFLFFSTKYSGEVCYVGVTQSRITHEEKYITSLFKMAILLWYLVFFQLL